MNRNSLITLLLILFSAACTQTRSITRENNPRHTTGYQLIHDWGKNEHDSNGGQISSIAVDKNQNVWVLRRTGRRWTNPFPDSLISLNTVTVLNGKTGKVIKRWGANRFIMPHSITVDMNNKVWITDVGLQQVFEFTEEGKLLKTWGIAKTAGDDSIHFNLPTDVTVAKDGSFYVSDGYGNSRVVKFSKEGNYMFEWGKEGAGKGEFELPHSVDLDAGGNVYVADRENNRIQKFDAKGTFIKEWKNPSGSKLYALSVDKRNSKVVAVDFLSENKIVKGADVAVLDTSLQLLIRFGRSGLYDGPVCVYHDVAVDNEGTIYTADIYGTTIQKFKKVTL